MLNPQDHPPQSILVVLMQGDLGAVRRTVLVLRWSADNKQIKLKLVNKKQRARWHDATDVVFIETISPKEGQSLSETITPQESLWSAEGEGDWRQICEHIRAAQILAAKYSSKISFTFT